MTNALPQGQTAYELKGHIKVASILGGKPQLDDVLKPQHYFEERKKKKKKKGQSMRGIEPTSSA